MHLLELRSALGAAHSVAGPRAPRWTDPVPVAGATPIRAAHLMELRADVVALELKVTEGNPGQLRVDFGGWWTLDKSGR